MPKLTAHNLLKLCVGAFLASAAGLWLTVRMVDPEAYPWAAWTALAVLAATCGATGATPVVYILKKARLRGRVTSATAAASLRQSLWGALLAEGAFGLWLGRVLTPATLLLWILSLLLAEMAVRSWTRRRP